MWSTNSNCLYVVNATTRQICAIVYIKYVILLLLFLLLNTSSSSTKEVFRKGTSFHQGNGSHFYTDNGNVTIYAYYSTMYKVLLNITWTYSYTENTTFNVSLIKLHGDNCTGNTTYNPIQTNYMTVQVPEKYEIVRGCTYKIQIKPTQPEQMSPIVVTYKVPNTALPTNLNAIAFSKKDSMGEESVKLNISWNNPTDDIIPVEYALKISHVPQDSLNCSRGSIRFISKNGVPSKNDYIVLPEEMDNKKLSPGCLYEIEIKVEPPNLLPPPSIKYKINECVGNVCTCFHNSKIPEPKIISVKQSSETTFNVTWNVTCKDTKWLEYHNITKMVFKIFLPSNYFENSYEKEINITNDMVNTTQFTTLDVPVINPGTQYDIFAHIENHQNCKNENATRLQFHTPQLHRQGPEGHVIYQVLIPAMFVMMFISFLWILCSKSRLWLVYLKCFNNSNQTQPQIQRIDRYASDGARNQPLISIPMVHSSIYSEERILVERTRNKTDKFEVSYDRLLIGKKIGGGDFGHVFIASASALEGIPGHTTVAVKKLKETASAEEEEEFLFEISMLKKIGRHPNIVTLLGYCTLQPPYCMIMEYIPCGDLLHYLLALRLQYEQKGKTFLFTENKNYDISPIKDAQTSSECSYITPESIPLNRLPSLTETEYTILGSDIVSELPHTPNSMKPLIAPPHSPVVIECVLDPKELQSFAIQIARGMKYLEQKLIVHRDLAARNVLINENKTLKISDFGLSRSGIYVNSKHKKVPLRWLSIEAIRHNLYTNKSDVWAYGIVLWEIGTLGGFPYPTVADNEILSFLSKNRLEKPENCTDELYALMLKCWAHSVDQRPSFKEIVELLETISNKKRVYIDFNQLNPSYIFPPIEQQNIK